MEKSNTKSPLLKGPRDNTPRNNPKVPLQGKDSEEPKTPVEAASNLGEEALRPLTAEEKAKMYIKGLELVGLTQDEARAIMDKILFEGHYSEEYTLGGKLPVVLRTRVYSDVERSMRYAEVEAPRIPSHLNDILARYNLAASLERYGDKHFEFPEGADATPEKIEEAFEKRYNFVMSLNTPIAGRLHNFIVEFDQKMNAVLADGAPENF